jgi:hypothetical protein
MSVVGINELFEAASVPMQGPVPWLTPIEEKSSGVYVISLVDPIEPSISCLPEVEAKRCNAGQGIIYIGRAKQIRRRIQQFYRHVYGNPRPHRGGQAILLLNCPMQVFWGVSPECEAAEEVMIEAFRLSVGNMPFANRMRAAKPVNNLK